MIVVDTSVLTHLFVEGEWSDRVRDLHAYDPDWIVPHLWQHEFLNVLTTLARNDFLRLRQAEAAWARALEFLEPLETYVDKTLALRLAVEQQLSAYDAQFVALARSHDVVLITLDKALTRKASEDVRSLRTFDQ